MKTLRFAVIAVATLTALSAASANPVHVQIVSDEDEGNGGSEDGPDMGCGSGFHLEGILCVPN